MEEGIFSFLRGVIGDQGPHHGYEAQSPRDRVLNPRKMQKNTPSEPQSYSNGNVDERGVEANRDRVLERIPAPPGSLNDANLYGSYSYSYRSSSSTSQLPDGSRRTVTTTTKTDADGNEHTEQKTHITRPDGTTDEIEGRHEIPPPTLSREESSPPSQEELLLLQEQLDKCLNNNSHDGAECQREIQEFQRALMLFHISQPDPFGFFGGIFSSLFGR